RRNRCAAEVPSALDRLDPAGGVEGQDAVDAPAAHGVGDLARRRRALVVDAEHARVAARGAHRPGQAATARVEPLIAEPLVDAQRAPHARGGHALPGLEAGAILGLADVGQDSEAAIDVAA